MAETDEPKKGSWRCVDVSFFGDIGLLLSLLDISFGEFGMEVLGDDGVVCLGDGDVAAQELSAVAVVFGGLFLLMDVADVHGHFKISGSVEFVDQDEDEIESGE